ncbi:hypothetical protein [Candidatus Burkholderia verschuerenii]|uniref:hypothetical protein n=1 Tax=Candidatus Burkholderia verschuerenii TaxID=242163 RepID=UPI00067D2967|nr:hypothetical protein [Candidatus Burkholderia verschuerenii]
MKATMHRTDLRSTYVFGTTVGDAVAQTGAHRSHVFGVQTSRCACTGRMAAAPRFGKAERNSSRKTEAEGKTSA